MFIALKRIFRLGWQNLFRDGGPTVATILVLSIPVALISSLLILKEANKVLISNIQEKADISIYFKEDASENDISKLEEEISKVPEVKEVKYISKEEALQRFKERHKDNPVLIEAIEEVGGNPFLASLNIKAFEASQYEAISGFLEKSEFKEIIGKVDYYQRKPLIDRIFSLTLVIEKTGISLFILMALVAVLVTFNTVRLSIFNQKEEIKIQKLVGASNWFVRGPFLVQGAISGILAALVSLSIFALGCWFLSPKIESFFFPEFNLFNYFKVNLLILFSIQLLVGISLGIVSSFIAIRKHLKA